METRRSSRLAKAPRSLKPTNYHEDQIDVDEPEDRVITRPRKRHQRVNDEDQDVSMPKPRVKRGKTKAKLALLPTMPLDVLYVIFGHLLPHDLLRLTRTNKSFRSLLLNRSARTVWKDALARDPNLPECPEDMTEPRYAHLAFEPICHLCGAPNIRDVIWEHRMRVCQKCYQAEVGHLFIRRDWGGQHDEFAPYLIWAPGPGSHHWTRSFLSTDLEIFNSTLSSLTGDEDAQERFKEERKTIVTSITAHAVRCAAWYQTLRSGQSDEKQELRAKRKQDIKDRLRDFGYGQELDWLANSASSGPVRVSFENHRHVRKAQALTDRIWSNIRESLIEEMETARRFRLAEKRSWTITNRGKLLRTLLQQYALEQPEGHARILPNVADIHSRSRPFRDIIETPLADDEEDSVTMQSFTDLLPQLPNVVEEWRQEETLKLVAMIPQANGDTTGGAGNSAVSDGRLELATSLFACSRCPGQVFHYANILAHSCDVMMPYTRASYSLHQSLGAYPRSSDYMPRVSFDKLSSGIAEVVIKLCDLDPARATLKDMDDKDARFTCTCRRCARQMQGMNWRQAVAHSRTTGRPAPCLQLLSQENTLKVKELEAEAEPPHLRMSYGYGTRSWTCAHCYQPKLTTFGLLIHMRDEHNKAAEITADDYVPDLDRFVTTLGEELADADIFLDVPVDHMFWFMRDELDDLMDLYDDEDDLAFGYSSDYDSDEDPFGYGGLW